MSGSTRANENGTMRGTSMTSMERVDRVLPPASDEHIIFDETRMREKRFGRKKNSKSGAFDKRYRKRSRHQDNSFVGAYAAIDSYHHKSKKHL